MNTKHIKVYTKNGERDFHFPISYCVKPSYSPRPLDTLLANFQRCRVTIVREDGSELEIRDQSGRVFYPSRKEVIAK